MTTAAELHDVWCSDPCEPSALGAFARRAAELPGRLMVVPDPATEPVTVAQLDAEPTPIYDAMMRTLPD